MSLYLFISLYLHTDSTYNLALTKHIYSAAKLNLEKGIKDKKYACACAHVCRFSVPGLCSFDTVLSGWLSLERGKLLCSGDKAPPASQAHHCVCVFEQWIFSLFLPPLCVCLPLPVSERPTLIRGSQKPSRGHVRQHKGGLKSSLMSNKRDKGRGN